MILRPACRLLAALSLTSIVGAANGPIDPTLLRNGDHPYHKTKAYARAIAWKPDTVHPNAEGATVIGETVYHALTGKSAAPKDPVLK